MNKKTLFFILLAVILTLPFTVGAQCGAVEGNEKLNAMLGSVKAVAIGIGITLGVIGWVVAGIMWLTSAGSPEKTGLAKKALIAAVIGTVLVVVAQGTNVVQDIICQSLGL
jgi:hypothetical protein